MFTAMADFGFPGISMAPLEDSDKRQAISCGIHPAGVLSLFQIFARHTRLCMDICGRRTRKPPAGALSKEARSSKAQRQRHKKAFLISHFSDPYRYPVARYMQAHPGICFTGFSLSRHYDRPPGVQMPTPSCSSCRPHFAPHADRMASA